MSYVELVKKDCKLILGRSSVLVQALLLGFLLIFIFSLARPIGEKITSTQAASIFWISTIFALILIFNYIYFLEQENNLEQALLLSPLTPQQIWLAKAISGFLFTLLIQTLFWIATFVFLEQINFYFSWQAFFLILLIDLGLVIIGSLLGALSQGHELRESFLSIVIFPLLVPLVLAGIKVVSWILGDFTISLFSWFKIVISFDVIYLSGGYILFPFIFSGE